MLNKIHSNYTVPKDVLDENLRALKLCNCFKCFRKMFFWDPESDDQYCPFEFLEKLRNEMPTISLVLEAKEGKLGGGGDEVELNEELPPAKPDHFY